MQLSDCIEIEGSLFEQEELVGGFRRLGVKLELASNLMGEN
jgi:hypothetical protein